MASKEGWSGESFWQEVIENELYPPKSISFMQGVEELLKGEDFSGKSVLDYGCGIGQVGRLVKERGADVTGADISDKLLEAARRHIKTVKSDGTELPFEAESFDYVMAFMVLHIMEDPERAVDEIARVLKPKGRLFFGIVHPHSDKWDLESGTAYKDKSTYHQSEERQWVFNLTDGRRFVEHYFHRPFGFYEVCFGRHFNIIKGVNPKLPPKYTKIHKYAETEFLLGKAVKN